MQRSASELNGFVTPSAVQGFPSFPFSARCPSQPRTTSSPSSTSAWSSGHRAGHSSAVTLSDNAFGWLVQ